MRLRCEGHETVSSSPRPIRIRRLAWGEAYQDGGYVFTREDGSPIHPHPLSQFFEKRVAWAGLPALPSPGFATRTR
jgi:hypothetical protein